jgi:hypothetical protein
MPDTLHLYLSHLSDDDARMLWHWLEDNLFVQTNMINVIIDSHETFDQYTD